MQQRLALRSQEVRGAPGTCGAASGSLIARMRFVMPQVRRSGPGASGLLGKDRAATAASSVYFFEANQ